MIESVEVSVTVTPEAAGRIAELGMRAEPERMLEHTRQVVQDLRRIDVVLAERYDSGGEPGIGIYAMSDHPCGSGDRTSWDWGAWKVETFPPEVCEHFAFTLLHENTHTG